MKPKHIKEQRQKAIRIIRKRQREIYQKIRELGYIKLKEPIRHGWFKEIVITENVERYKNKAAILELYDCIEKSFWGRTKEKADKQWFHKISKHLIYKEFPTISKKQFNRLTYKAQAMCTVFSFRSENKKIKKRFYIRIPKGAYKIKYTRAYITHSKRIDPELESELDLLEQQLYKSGYYEIWQESYWKNYWRTPQEHKQKFQVTKQLNALKKYSLQDIINDNISWEIN
ncbi:hypothetical protein [Tenacibaculum halocynthiae]|uniref:hypothetical protein n=1 Tax=Tenacibaculum halocynthiae TaxID=1254437 RepID=UPI003D66055C